MKETETTPNPPSGTQGTKPGSLRAASDIARTIIQHFAIGRKDRIVKVYAADIHAATKTVKEAQDNAYRVGRHKTKTTKREDELMSALKGIYGLCQEDEFGMDHQCAINNICVDMGADKWKQRKQ